MTVVKRRWRCCTLALLLLSSVNADLPLESNATLEFTTDEVTWLSFDLSPDGKTLVLEVLGDLYTLPVAGGTATHLTSGLAFDSQPVYAPNGKFIAFISDRSGSEDVWIVNADGSNPRKLSDTAKDSELISPAWSHDSSHIIVSVGDWKTRVYRVWAYHLAGGKGVRLAPRRTGSSTESHNHVGAQYSPDGRYLYYAFKERGFGYNQQLPLWQIRRLELARNQQIELTAAVGSAFRPSLSPDGSLMVYGTRFDTQTGLRMRNLQTGKDEWLVYPVQRDDQESRYTRDLLPKAVFSRDGTQLFYTVDGCLFGIDLESRESLKVPFEIPIKLDRVERLEFPYRIGIGPIKARLVRGLEPAPNGRSVAFSALAQIHTFEPEAGKLTTLTSSEMFASQPTWSPNGRELAFVDWSEQSGALWRVRARANAKPERITQDHAFYFDPLWSRDGKSIIALRASAYERSTYASDFGVGVGTDLVQISLEDGDVNLIAHAPRDYDPHFGPESDRLYLYEWPGMFREGDSGLFSIRLDGTDLRKHLEVTGPGIYNTREGLPAHRIRISPDGKHALLQQANQLYVVKLLGLRAAAITTKVSDCHVPCKRLTDIGVDEFAWDSSGEAAWWVIGHTVYRRDVNTLFNEGKDESNELEAEDETKAPKFAEEHESVSKHEIEIYVPRYEPDGSLVLRNATLLPVATDQPNPLIEHDLHIEGDRIVAIGKDLAVPAKTKELDLAGKFLVPGYIDTHAHIPIYRGVVSGESWAMLANLAYGVTTVMDVQPSTVDLIEYHDLVDANRMVGPRAFSTGPGVFRDTVFKSKDQALGVLQRYKNHYGVRNLKSYLPGNRKQRQFLIQAARELEMNPTTEGALDLKVDLTHMLDGFTGQEHNLPVVGVFEDVVKLMATTRIAYTPTLMVSYGGPFGENHFFINEDPRQSAKLARFTPPAVLQALLLRRPWFHPDSHVFDKHAKTAHEVVKAGGRVGVGSHGQLNGLGFHWELWALRAGGFSNFEALRAATRHGAEMLGISADIGSIEVGKLADLVVLNSNPMEDIRASEDIAFVIRSGFVRRGDDLGEIWPVKKESNVPLFESVPKKSTRN